MAVLMAVQRGHSRSFSCNCKWLWNAGKRLYRAKNGRSDPLFTKERATLRKVLQIDHFLIRAPPNGRSNGSQDSRIWASESQSEARSIQRLPTLVFASEALYPALMTSSDPTFDLSESIISIDYTIEDAKEIADEVGVDLDTALQRVGNWRGSIRDVASDLIATHMRAAIEHDMI